MITWNDFKCKSPYFMRHRIDNFGDYSQMWCGRKGKYIQNCDGCPYNEIEEQMRADPNNYPDWLAARGLK